MQPATYLLIEELHAWGDLLVSSIGHHLLMGAILAPSLKPGLKHAQLLVLAIGKDVQEEGDGVGEG